MEPIVRIMERTKVLREREERIATLETENAILHLQIVQLQGSLKKSLSTNYKRENERCDSCKKCYSYKEKVFELHNQIKLLRKSLCELHSQYCTYEQQLGRKMQALDATMAQRSTKALAETHEFRSKYLNEKTRRKELHNALMELRGNIRVHCRVRPVLSFDNISSTECIKCVDDEVLTVQSIKHSSISGPSISERMFEFERVHGPCDSQQDVFAEAKPLITSLLDGYNVCIMAYGQTGSGKSHTMLGEENFIGSNDTSQSGVMLLAAHELFRSLEEKDVHYGVAVTVAEVYNEQIRDLLSEREDNLRHEVVSVLNGGTEVTNLTLKPVSTSSDLIATIRQGVKRRAADNTLIHNHSSRSHLIVTVHVSSSSTLLSEGALSVASSSSSLGLNTTITPVGSRETTPMVSPVCSPRPIHKRTSSQILISSSAPNLMLPPSVPLATSTSSLRGAGQLSPNGCGDLHVKLQLVDLAGSECVGASGVSGNSLKEAQYINRSLSSLSDVLGALAEKRSHIPYRNSILTHLLQDTIGGDAKMVLMLCVSPTTQYLAESLRVLGFGSRARQVQRANLSKKQRGRHSQKT